MLRLRSPGGAVRTATGVIAGVGLAALIAACGANKPMRGPHDVNSAPPSPLPPLAEVHAEIERLDAAIAADRATLALDEPDADAMVAVQAMAVGHAADTCAPAAGDRCGDACTLSDSICDNAGRICGLADQLPGDAWARERCDAGKATCAASIERCCDCRAPM